MKYERQKRPYIAKLDEVIITREGDTAIIEYETPHISSVHFKIGDKMHHMSDQDILDLYNDGIRARLDLPKIINMSQLKSHTTNRNLSILNID